MSGLWTLALVRQCLTPIAGSAQDELHPDAHEDGGFGFTNKELLASQRACVP